MAINPAGQRPVWDDESHEIDEKLNLVANGRIVSPAKLYFDQVGVPSEDQAPITTQKQKSAPDKVAAR
jgi:hypothetical protein